MILNSAKHVRLCSALLVATLLAGPANAGPFEDLAEAREADERGDYATAFTRMRALAEAGYAPAQAEFGSLYFGGRGVSQDFETAYRWFALAASRIETARERDMALSNRDLAAQRLSPEQIARAEDWVKAWRPR